MSNPWLCQRVHKCNNRCDATQHKHHDIAWRVVDERGLEGEVDTFKEEINPKLTVHEFIKETRDSVMYVAVTLSPITTCGCVGPCRLDLTLEPCEA